ncbi:MAG: type III-A CRISPR-associated RAMP protein Csm3 [Acidobacteria bacterium]|nr:type III-A CRISPR-associated RAMP protein Csm3 [Acidobacteriota bacterium]
MNDNEFKATITLRGKIECVTGLHIGGSGGGYEIGGMDNPVIRNAVDGFPYIPGSSLKGKMRSLMEWAEGKISKDGNTWHSNNPDDVITRIFGTAAGMKDNEGNKENRMGPTRIIVRDAKPDDDTKKMMLRLQQEQGLPYVEIKTEVTINRITSKPPFGPRQMERVPVGSKFDFEIVYAIYEVAGTKVKDVDLLDKLFMALRLVEDSTLGGSGSRGSGQVKFHLGEPLVRTLEFYRNNQAEPSSVSDAGELRPLSDFNEAKISQLKQQIKVQIGQSVASVNGAQSVPPAIQLSVE